MRRLVLAMLVAAGCGDSFAAVDVVPRSDAGGDVDDAGESSNSSPVDTGHEIPISEDAGDVLPDVPGPDVPMTPADVTGEAPPPKCTPPSFGAPATCACYFAGSCPYVDGGRSRECLWVETPLTVTGQPTCRGCGLLTFAPNPCNRCQETFTCACLAPYLSAGSRCCDGAGGPYLTDFSCP